MREIKFRAWNKETGTMGHFDFTDIGASMSYGDPEAHISTSRYKKGALGEMGDYWEFNIEWGELYPEYKYPIMQYTGLKDKNGKEIYEGDILQTNGGFIEQIFWNEKKSAFYRYNQYGWSGYMKRRSIGEVIGNIYENPELLGEQDKPSNKF